MKVKLLDGETKILFRWAQLSSQIVGSVFDAGRGSDTVHILNSVPHGVPGHPQLDTRIHPKNSYSTIAHRVPATKLKTLRLVRGVLSFMAGEIEL